MVTNEGTIKLIDFGCSKKLDNTLSQGSRFVGTLNWVAPELFICNQNLKADIWSLGCTIYEMVCLK